MHCSRLIFACILFGAIARSLFAQQQLPPTRPAVNGVFPHGGQLGKTVDVEIRGNRLNGATAIHFLTERLRGEVLEATHGVVKARVTIDAAAEPGRHDFRILAPHGSTMAWFDVNTRPESFEKEPNNDADAAQALEFPVLLNGVVNQRDYDYFKFAARAGQTLVFDLAGGRNESGLDGVLSLLDAAGREIAYIDDYYWFKDPHMAHTFTKDGTYFLRVYGSGEGGARTDDYRLIAGEMPHVYHAMPLGGQRGKTVDIELCGVNLGEIEGAVLGDNLVAAEVVSRGVRSATLRLAIPKETPDGVYKLHVKGASLPVPFVVSSSPEVTVSTASAGVKERPVRVSLPVVANGVIDGPRVGHFFSFEVSEPQTVLFAVDSFRFDYHLDAMVLVYDEAGERIAYQDDPTTNSAKEPANVDPHLVFHLPKAGRYTVQVRDTAYRGDANYPYRLTLKRAEPTFTVGVVGPDDTLFRGRTHNMIVQVRRLEGWNTPVEVCVENLPPGVTGSASVTVPVEPTRFRGTCAEEHILDGTKIEYPLMVAADAPLELFKLRFKARGEMEGRVVEREVVPRYWFAPVKRIMGYAQGREMYATIADLPALVLEVPDRTTVPPGGEATVQVVVSRLDGGESPLELRAVNVPEGISIESVTIRPGATLADMKITAKAGGPGPLSAIIEGVAEGKVLGRTRPLEIEVRAGRARNEDRADAN